MQAIVLAKKKASVDQRKIELENRKKKQFENLVSELMMFNNEFIKWKNPNRNLPKQLKIIEHVKERKIKIKKGFIKKNKTKTLMPFFGGSISKY